MKKRKRGQWDPVLCGALMMALVNAPVFLCAGLFVVPITESLGISRTTFSLASTFCTLGGLTASVFAGKCFKEIGLRKTVIYSSIIISAAYFAYSTCSTIRQLVICAFFIGSGTILAGSLPVTLIINSCFDGKNKGRALGIALGGSSIGSFVMSPVITFINNTYSWRVSYRVLALLVILILVPAAIFLLDEQKAGKREKDNTEKNDGKIIALVSPLMIIMGILIRAMIHWLHTTYSSCAFAHFCDVGFESMFAATLSSITAVVLLISKIVGGEFAEKHGAKKAALICASLFFVTFALLVLLPIGGKLSALAISVFIGCGGCLTTVMISMLELELFGHELYARCGGILMLGMYVGTGISPVYAAGIFDKTGSYNGAWITGMIMMIPLVLMICSIYRIKQNR